jgi:hypothetical protein
MIKDVDIPDKPEAQPQPAGADAGSSDGDCLGDQLT